MFHRIVLLLSAIAVCIFVFSSGQEGDFLKQIEKACHFCSSCAKKMDVEIEVQGFKKH